MRVRFLSYCLMAAVFGFAVRADEKPDSTAPVVTLVTRTGSTIHVTGSDWEKLSRTSVKAVDKQGVSANYSGVAMSELLKITKVPQGEHLRKDWLRCYVAVEADDGYQAVYALPEFDPAFSDRTIILADARDGMKLAAKTGPLQMIVPGEKRQARWVKMVRTIRVVDHAPNAPAAGKYSE